MELPDSTPCILLAEDTDDDVFFARLAVRQAAILNPLHVVSDGREAIDYLSGDGKYSDRNTFPLPSVLILDLKMPRMDGFEVLAWARSQPRFRDLPIIVFSTSALESDLRRAQQLGATAFETKPAGVKNVAAIFQNIHDRWLVNAARPPGASLARTSTTIPYHTTA
jgi:CheY-like chemotaxis protein